MRCALFVSAGVLFAALLSPHVSQAAGNVLLPRDDSGSSSALPNLGLSVTPKTTAPVAATPEPAKKQEAPETKPQATEKTAPSSASSNPTRVIIETESSYQPGSTLPNSLTISMSDKSSFSKTDAAKITDKLGLSGDQIPSSCFLSARGAIKTDKSLYSTGIKSSPQVSVRYDGTITGYMLTAQALCLMAGPLPQKGGIIVKLGDRYVVPLQQINCPLPSGKVSDLIVVYDGSDKSLCAYQ
jgi:hypothetical protein